MAQTVKTNKKNGTLVYSDSNSWKNQKYTGETTPFNKRRGNGEMKAEMENFGISYKGPWKEDMMEG